MRAAGYLPSLSELVSESESLPGRLTVLCNAGHHGAGNGSDQGVAEAGADTDQSAEDSFRLEADTEARVARRKTLVLAAALDLPTSLVLKSLARIVGSSSHFLKQFASSTVTTRLRAAGACLRADSDPFDTASSDEDDSLDQGAGKRMAHNKTVESDGTLALGGGHRVKQDEEEDFLRLLVHRLGLMHPSWASADALVPVMTIVTSLIRSNTQHHALVRKYVITGAITAASKC